MKEKEKEEEEEEEEEEEKLLWHERVRSCGLNLCLEGLRSNGCTDVILAEKLTEVKHE